MKTTTNLTGRSADEDENCRLLQRHSPEHQKATCNHPTHQKGTVKEQLKIKNALYIAMTPSELTMTTKLIVISVYTGLGYSWLRCQYKEALLWQTLCWKLEKCRRNVSSSEVSTGQSYLDSIFRMHITLFLKFSEAKTVFILYRWSKMLSVTWGKAAQHPTFMKPPHIPTARYVGIYNLHAI